MKIIPSVVIGSGFGKRVVSQILKKNKKFNYLGIISRKSLKSNYAILKKNINKKKIFFLTTPPFTHYNFIKKFGKLKGLIVCEKPLANNLNEAKKISTLNEKIFCVNHQLRFSKITKILKKKLKKFLLLKIDITHETNHSILNKRITDWWSKTKKGGGQLFALGTHFIDYVIFFAGKIRTVECELMVNRSKRKISNDSFILNMVSKKKCLISIKSDSYKKKKEHLEINFYTKKNKNYKIINFEYLYENSKLIYKEKKNKDKFLNKNFWRICFNNFLNELWDYINYNKKMYLCKFKDALYTQKIIDVCYKSNKTKQLINIK
jgi:predicted dehydrogenase